MSVFRGGRLREASRRRPREEGWFAGPWRRLWLAGASASPWGREGTCPCEFQILLSGAKRRVRVSSLDLVFLKGLSFKMVSIPKWHILGCRDLVSCNTSPSSMWEYGEHGCGCARSEHAELGRARCPALSCVTYWF